MSDGAGANVDNLLGMARTAEMAGNSVEAMSYFNRVLEIDPRNSEAWIGKGKSAGWQSSLSNMRFGEMLVAFNHAIATADPEQKAATTADCVNQVNRLVTTLYGMSRKHMLEFVTVDNVWADYLNKTTQMLDALDQVHEWEPSDTTTLENIAHLCKDNIEGVTYRDRIHNNVPGWSGITPEYEKILLARRGAAIAKLQAIDPNFKPDPIQKKEKEACFVATAAVGSYDHPKVRLLRRFRDDWLCQRSWGRQAIAFYWRVGPLAAAAIKRRPTLQRLAYHLIVVPGASLATRLLRKRRR